MLGEALRLIRVLHDLSLGELAEVLKISKGYLSEIENNKKQPTIDFVNKFADFFKISPSSILFFSENLPTSKKSSDYKSKIRKIMIRFLNRIESEKKR